jgi:signal transduction histidine kinase
MAETKDKSTAESEQQALQLFGVLSATWAHRIANQLGLIRASAVMAEENLDDKEAVRNYLRKIREAVVDPLESISAARDLSRFPTGSSVGPVLVNSTIKKTLNDHYKSLEDKASNLIFQYDFGEDLPAVKADEQGLEEVLRNLVDNSIRAISKSKDGRIKIKTHLVDDQIAIDVADNGSGIAPALIPNLFQGFIPDRSGGGFGVGLFISNALVQSWGGTITLISSSREGTNIRIILDVWQPSASDDTSKYALIVEDQEQWRQILSEKLLRRGFNIHEASTIDEAVRLVRSNHYDLALLDVRLDVSGHDSPVLDETGLDIARLLHERDPETLVLMLTAYSDSTIVREAFSAGVDGFISKIDFSEQQLYKVLDTISLRRETERESIRQNQVNRMMYETLSMMSHELRTPLVTIKRNAEALDREALGPLTPKQTKAVKSILTAVNREFLMLNAHLDLNRIERGAEKLEYQEYDLIELIKEEITVHEEEAKDKNITLQAHLPKRKALVRIDVDRFRLALNPLMENAIKFSPVNSTISTTARQMKEYVEVQISDKGPGMQPDEIDRLLNLQYTETSNFTQRMRSSGLGLSVAKRMIELHGGKLWIESDGKNGTKVNFRIPINR